MSSDVNQIWLQSYISMAMHERPDEDVVWTSARGFTWGDIYGTQTEQDDIRSCLRDPLSVSCWWRWTFLCVVDFVMKYASTLQWIRQRLMLWESIFSICHHFTWNNCVLEGETAWRLLELSRSPCCPHADQFLFDNKIKTSFVAN